MHSEPSVTCQGALSHRGSALPNPLPPPVAGTATSQLLRGEPGCWVRHPHAALPQCPLRRLCAEVPTPVPGRARQFLLSLPASAFSPAKWEMVSRRDCCEAGNKFKVQATGTEECFSVSESPVSPVMAVRWPRDPHEEVPWSSWLCGHLPGRGPDSAGLSRSRGKWSSHSQWGTSWLLAPEAVMPHGPSPSQKSWKLVRG